MTTRAFWSLLVAIGLFCLPGTAAAQDTASQPWLHVQISGGGPGDGDGHHHDGGDGHDGSNSRDDDGDEGPGDGDRHGDDHNGDEGHGGDEGHHDDNDGHDEGDKGHDDDDGDEGHDREGDEEEDFNLNINVPLSAAGPLLSLVPQRILADGRLAVAGRGMPIDIGAMRNLWRTIADIGDAEFLRVDSGDETVRVARAGDQIHVQVEECDDDSGETVDVRLPVAVLDALLSGDGETLNVAAAVERLAGLRGDIVRIGRDGRQIRVWIDELAHPGE